MIDGALIATHAANKKKTFQEEEESMAGWEMVEKLDNQRVRFKRPRDARRRDEMLPPGVDPYRTQYGSAGTTAVFGIAIGVSMLLAFGIPSAFLFDTNTSSETSSFIGMATVIPIIVILFLIVLVAVIRSRR